MVSGEGVWGCGGEGVWVCGNVVVRVCGGECMVVRMCRMRVRM